MASRPGCSTTTPTATTRSPRAFVDGQPTGGLTRDHVLDNITLYWLTGTGASAARSYWESGQAQAQAAAAGQTPPEVKLPAASRSSRTRSSRPRAAGSSRATPTSSTSTRPTRAATSPPGNSRSSSPTRSGPRSGRCAETAASLSAPPWTQLPVKGGARMACLQPGFPGPVSWRPARGVQAVAFFVLFGYKYYLGPAGRSARPPEKLHAFYKRRSHAHLLIASVFFGFGCLLNLMWFGAALSSALRDAWMGGWAGAAIAAAGASRRDRARQRDRGHRGWPIRSPIRAASSSCFLRAQRPLLALQVLAASFPGGDGADGRDVRGSGAPRSS